MAELPSPSSLAIKVNPNHFEYCEALAQRLCLPLLGLEQDCAKYHYLVVFDGECLALQQTGVKAAGPVSVDFVSGAAAYRREQRGGELIVKAVGGNKQHKPQVWDVTAGLGRDSFVLASCGYPVTMLERSPVVGCLLEDGLRRAQECADQELRAVIARMRLICVDALDYMKSAEGAIKDLGSPVQYGLLAAGSDRPDVVVIDPMFPPSKKSALVKKDMRAFHSVVGADHDSADLLTLALATARHRVVVKRPRKSQYLADKKPNYSLEGKAIRFDIYALKAF